MISMNCELNESNCLLISGFPLENQRKLMKIRIFLNSNQHLSYDFKGAILEIKFNINDKTVITKEANKIISFIENVFDITISLDTKVKESIRTNRKTF